MDAEGAEKYILRELKERLSPDLYYHGIHHVIDVKDAALSVAAQEGVEDKESLMLLQTAALFHDSGFMNTYKDHEEEGCRIAKQMLPGFDYSTTQIEAVCSMILATKIPQNPETLLERIICDADLDYLGRTDFEAVSQTLYLELKTRGLVSDVQAWNLIQISFIGAHHYWTQTSKNNREQIKQAHLRFLKSL